MRGRKLDLQHWLFNLTLMVMGLLVVGFIISALTTRSGIEMNLAGEDLADRARLLTIQPGNLESENLETAFTDNRIEVEVLNGCGIPGMANEFTNYLRRYGYDVVRFTNAQRYDYPRTLVVSRGKDFDRARLVAQTLGVEPNAVENMPDPSLQLDVTVVLGQDFATLTSYREIISSGQ
ncbi:MAG: LytR C-terminal domain-containing protein [Fidelibacterota bacterium]|nr:MAG: LytR C-terminal domain-containing protein [Candidatus Neomarinimicrobiota bacterium]